MSGSPPLNRVTLVLPYPDVLPPPIFQGSGCSTFTTLVLRGKNSKMKGGKGVGVAEEVV